MRSHSRLIFVRHGKTSKHTMADYLFEDTPANGMTHALISCLSSKNHPGKVVLKIRGVYTSEQAARDDAPRLQQEDGAFDTYVVEIYRWLLLPPDASTITDVNYQESTLNEIVKGAYKNRQEAKTLFEQRKREILLNGLDADPEAPLIQTASMQQEREQKEPSTSTENNNQEE